MSINKKNIALSLLLLALVLTGRVGIHIFHHHDSFPSATTKVSKLVATENYLFSSTHEENTCNLCQLDAFQEIASLSLMLFTFGLVVAKPVYNFIYFECSSFSFLKKNKGPPAVLAFV